MDFGAFSEAEFDAKAWINGALGGVEDSGREEAASALALKLQLFIGEVNRSLEEASNAAAAALPRLLRELETMQAEALLLQSRMQSVQTDVRKVETKTTLAMDSLLKIHAQKSEIASVEAALKEMENWAGLTGDMEEVFASGDVPAMAERLKAVQNSVQVIGSKAPDYAAKAELVERLKDQFFAAVSPALIAAFTSRSAEQVAYYKGICADLNRPEELLSYHQKCLRMELGGRWASLLAEERSDGLEGLWRRLFDSLLATWSTEVAWAHSSALPQPAATVAQALAKALGGLEPSLEATLRDRLDLEADKLGALVGLKQSSTAFLTSLSDGKSPLTSAVYAPLLPLMADYQQYQQSLLLQKLSAIDLPSADLLGSVERLEPCVDAVFDEALSALEHCAGLSGPLGLPLLLKALATYLGNFASQLRKLIDSARPSRRTAGEGGEAATRETNEPLGEDWPRFAALLHFTTAIGTAFLRLERLEEALALCFAQLRSATGASLGLEGAEAEAEKEGAEAEEPFSTALLSSPRIRDAIHQLLLQHASAEAAATFLPEAAKQLTRVNQRGIRLLAEQMYGPLEHLLSPLPKLPAWAASTVGESTATSLPAFALSPHSYITQVGAYAMRLAHELEPFLSQAPAGLSAALAKASLPHLSGPANDASALLEAAGRGTMARFVDAASRIAILSPPGTHQLLSDIDYLSNVVEDLGLEPSETLASLRDLLKMDAAAINSSETAAAHPAPLIAEVKAMRRL